MQILTPILLRHQYSSLLQTPQVSCQDGIIHDPRSPCLWIQAALAWPDAA
jgi:hypothetical protein